MIRRRHWFAAAVVFAALLAVPRVVSADAGVLIPSNSPEPNPQILSLEEMKVDIKIDNGTARVSILQIFASHSGIVLEGEWIFALPGQATISDFAIWDGVTRIPGVILERRRAEEIYEDLKWQAIDPGLLQMGEYGAEEARRTAVFSAKVVPIPAFGYKRVEIEYHEPVPVENLQSYFAIPLRPDAYRAQTAAQLTLNLEIASGHAMRDFRAVSTAYPLTVGEQSPNRVRASYSGRNVMLSEDFAVNYTLDRAKSDTLEVLTYRNPNAGVPNPGDLSPEPATVEPGYFLASALLAPPTVEVRAPDGAGPPAPVSSGPPRTVIALFDTSLSMQWEKLTRSFRALEGVLRALGPRDRFNVLLFGSNIEEFQPTPAAAQPTTIDNALQFVRAARLRGGTDLQAAVTAALAQAAQGAGERYIVLLTDGGATRGTIANARLADWFEQALRAIPAAQRPRPYVFAVGDDANMPLLRIMGRQDGIVEWVRSTEPLDFKLTAFLSKIGRRPLEELRLSATPVGAFDLIYPLESSPFAGSMARWAGLYKQNNVEAGFGVTGRREGGALSFQSRVTLPEQSLTHPHVPRTWARARVDALLEKIEREGEDRATIDEIIRLAKKYKFVTPYTSFLAAPRSLLRPRVIRPGDPVLRVRTDPAIVSVTALFPFGLVKKLKYLGGEDIWQTRFLAPTDMEDGEHDVRLVLRDREGRVYRESKSFIIASKPPVVRVHLDKTQYRRGETIDLKVSASKSTRTLVARLYGTAPVELRWNEKAGYNTGRLVVPGHLPAGEYKLLVTAEDFAHNIGAQEVSLAVAP